MNENKEAKKTIPCPFCNLKILEAEGQKTVIWNFGFVRVAMELNRAIDLIDHVHDGLIQAVTGMDIKTVVEDFIKSSKEVNAKAPQTEPIKKEFVN
jgi:hypothetical protein